MKKILFVLLCLLGWALPASAQEPLPPIIPPEPPIWHFDGLRIAYQRVNVTIADQVAVTHIDQLFVNDNDWMLEGTYLFPLPAGAAVSQLTMWVDGVPIEAKILAKEEARAIYDEIVRQLRDPALLEYVGSSAIQANVFPIPAHAERRIEIEYSQVLPADNGLIHFTYPQSTHLYTNTPLDEQSIRVELASQEAIRAIYSPSHAVSIDRDGEFRALVGYEASRVTPDQDFELYYTVSPENIGLNLLSYKEAGQDGFFLLLVAPTIEVNPDEVVSKDLVIVLDTSGSMEGQKLSQAKAAVRYVIDHLNPTDRYNIVTFSTGVRSFMPELTPAASRVDYAGFIDNLEAVGGTNISLALLEAVGQADAERSLTILFLTDGLATEGITDTPNLLDAIDQAAPTNVRLFAFGVGDDVDTILLDSLAANHRGATTYVRPHQAVDEAVSSFYAKVSTPVLADVRLTVDGVTVEQLYPATLPDLFAGTQLIIAGRYREGGPATITLSGQVNGQPQSFTYSDNLFRDSGGDAFIPRLWATRAIGHLLNEIRLHGENAELVQSIVNLSIRYGIITPYTSYLIKEDDIFSQTGRESVIEEAAANLAAPKEASGEAAVDAASMAGALSEAGVPMAIPTIVVSEAENGVAAAAQEMVRLVGSKTFVYRQGVWTDTAFDADAMQPHSITFASDAYFDLLTAIPELGQYLALGEQLLVVHEQTAYQVIPGAETAPQPTAANGEPATEVTPTSPPATAPATPAADAGICPTALLVPLILLSAGILTRRRRSL